LVLTKDEVTHCFKVHWSWLFWGCVYF